MAALASEAIFHVGSFAVTNTLFTGSIVTLFIIALAIIVARTRSIVPKGIYGAIEAFGEAFLQQMDGVTQDRAKSEAFFPIILSIFFFVLFNNFVGQLPGVGTLGLPGGHGEEGLIPFLRPSTSDLNTTLALATVAVIATHIIGLRAGAADHISKFFNVRGIYRAFSKGPMAIAVSFVEFFVGIIETVGEVAKVLSLSLRLFGNVFAGEILVGVILGLMRYVVPIPFLFMEIFVSLVQASVFALLTLAFMVVAGMSHGHEEGGAEHAQH